MFKKLTLLPLLYIPFLIPNPVLVKQFGTTTVFKSTTYSNNPVSISQSKCLIAWDLHDVVLTKNSSSHALNFISAGAYHYGPFSNLRYLRKIRSLKNRYDKERRKHQLPEYSWEELLYVLLRSPHEKERFYGQYILKCVQQDQYTLNPAVGKLIHKLSECGHRHAVLSNINPEGLALHIDVLLTNGSKTGLSLKELEPLIEMLTNQASRVTPHANNNWVHKPEHPIYHEFLAKNISRHSTTNNSTITIFIDDKEANVRAAIEAGFDIGIVYTNSQELEEVLTHLGLLS